MRSFLCVVKDWKCRTPSVVCGEERMSHTAPPPPVGARSSQWESPVCMMMAEGDESLELFPPSKKTKSAVWTFFVLAQIAK